MLILLLSCCTVWQWDPCRRFGGTYCPHLQEGR